MTNPKDILTANSGAIKIRAGVHESALRRVTRMFAGIGDICTELLQNARRAGATRVSVTLSPSSEDGYFNVTVTDDGTGIRDPAVLLSFGENGWDEDLVHREDAAGMGFLSLARRGCLISSRTRAEDGAARPGWRVSLDPEHFLGESEAAVYPDDTAPYPHGTSVRFRASAAQEGEHPGVIRNAVQTAALHYPLPVTFNDQVTPAEEELMHRKAFLDGAVHAEPWKGLVFGIFRNPRRFGLGLEDVNFHGLTIPVRLPGVESVGGVHWKAAADIDSCPDLELVLPARKEAVETPFLGDMRNTARLAIYRAMAADDNPRPSFLDWEQARDAGIDIEPAPPELRPWRPGIADIDDWREMPKLEAIGPDALLMDCDPEPPEAQAIWRAAKTGGLAGRIFEADGRLEGYPWYDRIPRITGASFEVTGNGRTCAPEDYPVPAPPRPYEAPLPERPDAICIGLTVRADTKPGRNPNPALFLATDLAFAGEAWSSVDRSLPLVTAGSGISSQELADLLRDAFFAPSDDIDSDSRERQESQFEQEARHIATRLLDSDDEAIRNSIMDVVAEELFWLIPRDRGVDISVRGRKVTVALQESAGNAG